jgi:hypothetical protein
MFLAAVVLASLFGQKHRPQPNVDEVPYPAYIEGDHKHPRWVFLGALDDDALSILVDHEICWMTIPPITAPCKNEKLLEILFGGKGLYAVAVGADQYRGAREILEHTKTGANFTLDDLQEKPNVIFPPPSDHNLALKLLSHEAVFEELRKVLLQDKKLTRVGPGWIDPLNTGDAGVSSARLAKYRELASKVSPQCRVSIGGSKGEVEVMEWGFGATVTRELSELIVYRKRTPHPLVRVIDPYRVDLEHSSEIYRRISGHWYVEYSYTP